MRWFRLLVLFTVAFTFLLPSEGYSKRRSKKGKKRRARKGKKRYKSSDLPALLKQSEKTYIENKKKNDPKMKKARSKHANFMAKLRKGKCTKVKLKVGKVKIKLKKLKLCVKSDKKNNMILSLAGKKIKVNSKVVKKVRKVVDKMVKDFKKTKKAMDAAGKEMKKIGKQIEKGSKKAFNAVATSFKKKAKKFANAMVRGMAAQIASIALKYAAKQMQAAIARSNSTFAKKITAHLAKSNQKAVQQAANTSKTAKALKVSAKTALISAALAVGAASAKVVIACWSYGKAKKRECLKKNIGIAIKDSIYYTVVYMIWFAADGLIVEPLSHILAAKVSVALAAATAGVGAVAYPIVYVASSAALNGIVFASLEAWVKPKWDRLYNKHAKKKAEAFATKLLKGIPDKNLKCFAPKSACKY